MHPRRAMPLDSRRGALLSVEKVIKTIRIYERMSTLIIHEEVQRMANPEIHNLLTPDN